MISHRLIERYILSLPKTWLDYPFGESVAVYKVRIAGKPKNQSKMYAIVAEGQTPIRLSLKCDPILAELLRHKYDEVMPGYHLNKKHWNTIVLSGQLSQNEIEDLIRHSYELVTKTG